MFNWNQISNPQLDIVGIVAVLGEGSTSRNAQASALGWHHLLPRLLPAPQALLKHENIKRLPTVPGTVVGAYSGNVKFELNFFCQLLHEDNLNENEVELVYVSHLDDAGTAVMSPENGQKLQQKNKTTSQAGTSSWEKLFQSNEQAYGIKKFSTLTFLSLTGFASSIGMIALSVHFRDGFAFLAVLLLSLTSMIVGIASWWTLDFKNPPKTDAQKNRQNTIPDSDVVIYYPRQGAFRIVRCSEKISRLYFKSEKCEYVFGDDVYRLAALSASILLMAGLLSMSNAKTPMQIAFAAVYIAVNAVYWGFSALNTTGRWGHWERKYRCESVRVLSPDPDIDFRSPARSETAMSDRNRPVLTQEPMDLPEHDMTITNSPTTFTNRSPLESTSPQGQVGIETPNVRKRRVTFQEATQTPSNAVVPPTPIEMVPVNKFVKGKPLSPLVTALPTQTTPEPGQSTGRQQTRDLEGMNSRPRKPLGSFSDLVRRWFRGSTSHADTPPRKADTFTTALWKAIVVTGTTRWLGQTHIAPDNEVWSAWFADANKRAATFVNKTGDLVTAYTIAKDKFNNDCIQLPSWDYQGRLDELFAKEADQRKRRPPPARHGLAEIEMTVRNGRRVVKGITDSTEERLRLLAKNARRRALENRLRRNAAPVRSLTAISQYQQT